MPNSKPGPDPTYSEELKRRSIRLTDTHVKALEEYGENKGAAVRKLVEEHLLGD